jgi:dihydrofolate reductase
MRMRKLIFFMHTSLDGFVAGLHGEMDWIKVDDAVFDFVGTMTDQADTALYGRVTYQMMESYWPTAGDKPNASKHDIEHSKWYNKVSKIVLDKTIFEVEQNNTKVISENISDNINKLKQQDGKNIFRGR